METSNMGYKVCPQMHYCSFNWVIWWTFLFLFNYVCNFKSYNLLCRDELVVVLEVGDNFIVIAEEWNDEGASFWLILCTKPLHKVKTPFIDNWGNSYEEGDDVVGGLYYQKWGNNDNYYVFFKDSHKVYVYSHIVMVVKFLMPPRNHKVIGNDAIYELLEEILWNINVLLLWMSKNRSKSIYFYLNDYLDL